MQSRDDLTDHLAARFQTPTAAQANLQPYPIARRTAAVVLAWLIPGAGHLLLGKFGRAALFFFLIAGSFVFGLLLHGRLFWPVQPDPPGGWMPLDLISVLWFIAQVGSGLCYIVPFLGGAGTSPMPWAATYEYGNTFMFLAGLLNYLVVHDAYDIGVGRKR